MNELLLHVFQALLIAVFSAVATSLITIRLSREKFRSERWWEKKFDAYERVIDAFHHSKNFYSEHIRATELQLEYEDSRLDELKTLSRKSRDEILRASDIGGFILSPAASSILAKYEAASENMPRQPSWQDYLDLSWSLANQHMKAFVAEAQIDLKRHS
jgi:hypothetical protein